MKTIVGTWRGTCAMIRANAGTSPGANTQMGHIPVEYARKMITVLLAVVIAIGMISCGSQEESSQTASPDAAAANSAGTIVDAATAGSVKGLVKLEGTAPRMRTMNMNAVPNCAKQHSAPAMQEDVVVGDNNELQNVVVYLQGDFSQYSFEMPTTPTQIEQKGCVYIPHVVAVRAGAPVQFLSSDDTTHNIHPVPRNNREWNESQASRGAPIEQSFAREEVAIPVKCNLHPWMRVYVAVLNHPYFQVTDEDGSFELRNVPPGTYTLAAWHEYYGSKTQQITVNPKQEQSLVITMAR